MSKQEKNGNKPKKKNKVRVDFAGVETRAHIPDGQYHARVAEITVEEGNQAQYLKWGFEIIEEGKLKNRKLYYNTSLAPQALWNLRNLLETLGVETPDSEIDLDLDSYISLELMIRVESEVYEGKERPKVTDFTPIEEAAAVSDDEKESTDEDEKEDEKDDDEKDDDEDDEKDDDEDDEDKKEAKLTAAEVREMDDKELADLVKTHGLKLDLSKIVKKAKRIAAVVDAMEAKDLLADEA